MKLFACLLKSNIFLVSKNIIICFIYNVKNVLKYEPEKDNLTYEKASTAASTMKSLIEKGKIFHATIPFFDEAFSIQEYTT